MDIRPFRGLRYDPAKVIMGNVVTQPYDKITPEMQSGYYEKSPYNYVRVVLGRDKDRYSEALQSLDRWIADGAIIQDDKPAVYPYWQEFEYDGQIKTRKGFVAAFNLGDRVLKHERTLSKPKADRLNLFRKTRKNLEQIFLLYDSEYCPEPSGEPIVDVRDEYGVRHRLWRIDDPSAIEELEREMADQVPLIADGHHRYEVSLEIQRELCEDLEKPCNYRMATFVSARDPGLVVLPNHRLVYGCDLKSDELLAEAEKCFEVKKGKGTLTRHEIGLFDGEEDYTLRLKDETIMDDRLEGKSDAYKMLDVVILHELLIRDVLGIQNVEEHVSYIRDEGKGRWKIGREYQYLFTLCPTLIEEVREIGSLGEAMPQKSTDFYPKMISGLVAFDLERW